MKLRVVDCYKISIGTMIFIESARGEYQCVGRHIKRNDAEIWEVTGVVFEVQSIYVGTEESHLRSYRIRPVADGQNINCEEILSSEWEALF